MGSPVSPTFDHARTVVVDASVMINANRNGPVSEWARRVLSRSILVAPHSLGVEVVQGFRRLVASGECSEAVARRAIRNIDRLSIELQPFAPFAARVWELRHNVTAHDAWYVAVAERLTIPLFTLDNRLARASGPRCDFLIP